jgi:hypothetical protein
MINLNYPLINKRGGIIMHETQTTTHIEINNSVVVNEDLLPLQRVEGGGSIKPTDFSSMPKPIRMIGYFIFGFLILMVSVLIISSILK